MRHEYRSMDDTIGTLIRFDMRHEYRSKDDTIGPLV